jgi:hypothetical protein
MGDEAQFAGDLIPSDCKPIEVRVSELMQLFNAMDGSPFRERDLDPDAEAFIVRWAREAPRGSKLALLVTLDRAPGPANEATVLRDAMREFFSFRAEVARQRLRQLLRIGEISLVVGLAFLAVALGIGDALGRIMKGQRMGELLRQGLVIIGWVAMWRPLEIFLYGWWPIRSEAKLFDALSAMPVRIAYRANAHPEGWRGDWPAVTTAQRAQQKSVISGPVTVPERGSVAAAVQPLAARGPEAPPL